MTAGDAVVREAGTGDQPAILDLLLCAFEGEDLRPLVTDLLADPDAEPRLSLVAERAGEICGHVLFSAATVEGAPSVRTALLAPLAVRPGAQGGGLGIRLVEAGLDRLAARGTGLVLVLGNPDYYRRFGFVPASTLDLSPPYPLSKRIAAAWQVLVLSPEARRATGRVRPARAFDDPALWAPPPEE